MPTQIRTSQIQNWPLTPTTLVASGNIQWPKFGVNQANGGTAMIEILNSLALQWLRIENDLATRIAFSTFVTADGFVRFTFLGNGRQEWGNGTTLADTNLYRSAVGTLTTDGVLQVLGAIDLGNADTTLSRLSAGAMAVEGIKVPTISSTDTLTNKRKQPRVVIVTQSATPAINTDNGDIIQITGLAQAITSMSSGLTGTPVAGEMIMIQTTDNGTAQGITWGASFASTTNSSLPTTTVASTILRTLFQRNNANTIWDCVTTTAISVGISRSISSIAIATTGLAVASTDYVYIATAGVVFTLPTAVGNTNSYTLKATVTGVSFATTSAQTVDGSTTGTLVANQSITFISNGTNWFII